MTVQKRPSKETWAKVRAAWEADPREGYQWLVNELELNVSITAIRKRSLSEGWAKPDSHNTIIHKAARAADIRFAEKVSRKVSQIAEKVSQETFDPIDARSEIINQHREDWGEFRVSFSLKRMDGDIDEAKKAEVIARVIAARQAGERKAWQLDESASDGGKLETVNLAEVERILAENVRLASEQRMQIEARNKAEA